MSLIKCIECGHDVSASAVACPNCGRPIAPRPVVDRRVVVTDTPDREGFPKWAFIPIALLGIVLVVFFFAMMSRENDDTANTRVSVEAERGAAGSRRDTGSTDSQTLTVPPSDTSGATIPPADMPGSSVTVPGSQTTINQPPDKGTVKIDARVATRSGQPRAVTNEKFYLLDQDLETILSDADLDPIEGNTLTNSFGLSILYPDRFGDFQRAALRAIKDHIKYSGTTDSSGQAQLGSVDPDSYYLFGITKAEKGFAVWNSPVVITAGENVLNLSPARITEMNSSE